MPIVKELQPVPVGDRNSGIARVQAGLAALQNLPLLDPGPATRREIFSQAGQRLGVGLKEAAVGAGLLGITDFIASNPPLSRRKLLRTVSLGVAGVTGIGQVLQPDSALAAPPPPDLKLKELKKRQAWRREALQGDIRPRLERFLHKQGLGLLPKDPRLTPTYDPKIVGDPETQEAMQKVATSLAKMERGPISPEIALIPGINFAGLEIAPDRIFGIGSPSGTNPRTQRDLIIGVSIAPAHTQMALADVATFPSEVFYPTRPTGLVAPRAPGIYPPDVMVIGGERIAYSDDGRLFVWTPDSGPLLLATGNGTVLDVAFTPDRKYLILSESNHWTRAVSFVRIDLATGVPARFVVDGHWAVGRFTELRINPQNPSEYICEVPVAAEGGYSRITFGPTGVGMTQINRQENEPGGPLLQFIDASGRYIIGLHHNWNMDPRGRRIGTLYWNINDADTYHIQPLRNIYQGLTESEELLIAASAADASGNLGFMGVGRGDNNLWSPEIEVFLLSNPMDLPSRRLIPKDGTFPGNARIAADCIGDLEVIRNGAERYLLITIKNSSVASENGMYRRRITNGITPADVWEKITAVSLP